MSQKEVVPIATTSGGESFGRKKYYMKLTDKEVAANLCISPSTVQRIFILFQTIGGVSKRGYPSEQAHRSITKPVEFFIIDLLLEKPGIYLREVQFELETHAARLSHICRMHM